MTAAPAIVTLGPRSAGLAARLRDHLPGSEIHAPICADCPADVRFAKAALHVAALFATELKEIDWSDITESLPALVTALAIPLTFSIAEGIGMGFIAYAGIKLLTGRTKEIGAGVAIIALAFVGKIAFSH